MGAESDDDYREKIIWNTVSFFSPIVSCIIDVHYYSYCIAVTVYYIINYCVYFRFVNNKSCYRFKDCRFHVLLCALFWSSSRFNTSLVCPWSASCLKPFCFHQHLLLSLLVKCRISQSPVTVQLQGIQIERTTTKFSASSDGSFCISYDWITSSPSL